MEHGPTASKRVAAAVAEAITLAGLSRRAIARAAGIKPSTLSRRLSGVTPLNVDELHAIARELHVKPSDLTAAADDQDAA